MGLTAATITGESVALCRSPVLSARLTLPLRIVVDVPGVPSLPGLQRASANALPFTLYDADLPTMVHRLEPAYGPPAGGSTVVVRGDNFANGAVCHFGYTDGGGGSALPPVPATFYSVGRVACVAPARAAGVGSVTLSVSDADGGRRGVDASSTQVYTYYDDAQPPRLMAAAPHYATTDSSPEVRP